MRADSFFSRPERRSGTCETDQNEQKPKSITATEERRDSEREGERERRGHIGSGREAAKKGPRQPPHAPFEVRLVQMCPTKASLENIKKFETENGAGRLIGPPGLNFLCVWGAGLVRWYLPKKRDSRS